MTKLRSKLIQDMNWKTIYDTLQRSIFGSIEGDEANKIHLSLIVCILKSLWGFSKMLDKALKKFEIPLDSSQDLNTVHIFSYWSLI